MMHRFKQMFQIEHRPTQVWPQHQQDANVLQLFSRVSLAAQHRRKFLEGSLGRMFDDAGVDAIGIDLIQGR